jgi:hypothetical protein
MKYLSLALLGLLMAGCSTVSSTKNDAGPWVAMQAPVQYHHELVNNYNEGISTFLQLVPDTVQ